MNPGKNENLRWNRKSLLISAAVAAFAVVSLTVASCSLVSSVDRDKMSADSSVDTKANDQQVLDRNADGAGGFAGSMGDDSGAGGAGGIQADAQADVQTDARADVQTDVSESDSAADSKVDVDVDSAESDVNPDIEAGPDANDAAPKG